MLTGRHLIESNDFSLEEQEEIFTLADQIMANEGQYLDACRGKLLSTLFYEPSTRTRFSFEAAMLRLGGQVVGFSEPNSSSVSKGESIADTIRTVGCYADIAVIRHPKEGAPKLASKNANIPVINAGDGGHQHPTQTLTDLLTIRSLKKSINHQVIGLCGDLKFGRTAHSLVKALNKYENIRFIFISPIELTIPEYILEDLDPGSYTLTDNLDEVIDQLDILYMTRIQKERFFNEEEYLRLKGYYILTKDKLTTAKEDMIVMHPLPRVDEICSDVDDDPRAVYFKQAKFGMYVRMALILKLLGGA
ncbi:aspartate carbamoyltransferase, catalytic subunit [Petrocella atlantisensis]|uniref:Aspartate carbamoyltransferase n=1 Tax=Petrocella atlantisensis TaxID=2173034 RepID=A0A3P7P8S8_9FIRM|nr:aspartate carbamoyltransferase [Petrocella atlantisensis]MCF8018939.1 aspartate carbamoyltransferase [Vallitaleaceae bacterium]VDN46603.1 aspartate carbamoyltransferase, catalytic subunit [Petrocella atlantisensis]